MRRIRDEVSRLAEGSYLEVRYEELLAEPMAVLRVVADHLQLESHADWLERSVAIVRPRPAARPGIDDLHDLDLEDLLVLREVGGVPVLDPRPKQALDPAAALAEGEALLSRGGNAEDAASLALAALASGGASAAILGRGRSLLGEALSATGRDPRTWRVMGAPAA
jgi:hypothetical protein